MRAVPEAYVLKFSILVAQRLALHQNGVEFRQLSIGDIRISLATTYDVVRRRSVLLKKFADHKRTHKCTHAHAHAQSHVWRQARCLKK